MERNKPILLGVDGNFSPATRDALRLTGKLLSQVLPDGRVLLLHVIPVPYDPSPVWGKSLRELRSFLPTSQQRLEAERTLWRARKALEQQGIAPQRIQWLQRIGSPADEIVKVAGELAVDRIIIGSHANTLAHQMRRLAIGSLSHHVLRHAPCPVILAVPPPAPRARNLVVWYKQAVTFYLHEHQGTLMIFTACEAAQMFAPPEKTAGSREVQAASRALEQLAADGILCCARVKGEVRYFND